MTGSMTGDDMPPAPVAFEVLEGGALTTVQDVGRPDWGHLGVPRSGAADPASHAIANLLAGNPAHAAALEATFVGPTLRAVDPVTVALSGADLRARIRGGRALAIGRSHHLAAGDIVEMPGDPSAGSDAGSRAYIAVAGGIEVPIVLGSRSTCLAGGFGGIDGRPLRSSDRIRVATGRDDTRRSAAPDLVWPRRDDAPRNGPTGGTGGPAILRVLGGPHDGLDQLVGRAWRVAPAADRVGVRLDGPPLADGIGGEVTTQAVPWGAIQLPPDGRPIVLGVDHGVTGGYRMIGVVISADRPIIGQLRPGAPVRLVRVDRETALAALRAQQEALVTGAAALRESAGWETLVHEAGS